MRKTALTILIAISAMACYAQIDTTTNVKYWDTKTNKIPERLRKYPTITDTLSIEKGVYHLCVIPIVPIDYKRLWAIRRRANHLADSLLNGFVKGKIRVTESATSREITYRCMVKLLDEILEP